MDLKDKLRLEIGNNCIAFSPYRGIMSSLYGFVAGIAVTAIILGLFNARIGEGGRILCCAIMVYLFIHGLYDLIFKLNVRYIFDGNDQVIYRENLPFGRRKLMRFEEAVIITSSESCDWHYCLGIKEKQFLKSYKISPDFGSGKASEKAVFAYEKEILNPIVELLS